MTFDQRQVPHHPTTRTLSSRRTNLVIPALEPRHPGERRDPSFFATRKVVNYSVIAKTQTKIQHDSCAHPNQRRCHRHL